MKRILVINPVTNPAFAASLASYLAELLAGSDVAADVVSLPAGPVSVETYFDEAFAVPGVLETVSREAGRYHGIVVNCFADPGVDAAREMVTIPVVGPAEASMLLACTLGHRFAVVSVHRNSGPWVERQVRAIGLEARLAWATGVEIPVAGLVADPEAATPLVVEAAREAVGRHAAEVVVLGCTGMARLARAVREELARDGFGVPVIEPLAASLRLVQALLELGLTHSRVGLYGGPGRCSPRPCLKPGTPDRGSGTLGGEAGTPGGEPGRLDPGWNAITSDSREGSGLVGA